MASPPPATGGHLLANDVKKRGYLRKQKHGHRRYFVLREPGDRAPARLEYYESEKKWRSRSAARRVIPLDSCLCVNKRADAKHKHLLALYTRDEYFAVAAEDEGEQECWYQVLAEVIAQGKVLDGPAATSSLVGFEESSYGLVTPTTSVYKEVWQVVLKAKGLGQVKGLTGVYRLCLSGRTIGFVKINSDVAAVSLQLMNIRRCGHSDSFFFIEVGRSAVTGPGEFWMQAEDSVVAQNIHETILEAMRAMKELSEFRPRSKSQSAGGSGGGGGHISLPARRNLNNPPPSQTGLARGSNASCRFRTASEGDRSMTRPASMAIPLGGSPTGAQRGGGGGGGAAHLIRSQTLSGGRTCRLLEPGLQHSRSMPASNSFLAGAGPSPRRAAPAAALTPDLKARRPFSCSGSISGSPSDAGFLLGEECCWGPGGPGFPPPARSGTPDSPCGTPPPRDPACGHVLTEASGGGADDRAYRKRTCSLTTPRRRGAPPPALSSASLDERSMMRAALALRHSASPKLPYPEDYGHVAIGADNRGSGGGGGYVAMTPGVTAARASDYMPMSPMSVSAPKLIENPRAHATDGGGGYKAGSPPLGSGSLEDRGYMRMWAGSRGSMGSPDGRAGAPDGEYMNMSPGGRPALPQPSPDPSRRRPGAAEAPRTAPQAGSSPREADGGGGSQYVLMSPQSQRPRGGGGGGGGGGEADYYAVTQPSGGQGRPESSLPYRPRPAGVRPNRLPLDAVRTLPSMTEHPARGEPRSPGEYIDIDFGRSPRGPRPAAEAGGRGPDQLPEAKGDYTEMTFGPPGAAPQPTVAGVSGFGDRGLSAEEQRIPEVLGAFLLGAAPIPDPDRSAKVIRAHPQGRRRHSSETFASTATVTPVTPSFAGAGLKRHSSVENLSSRSSEGSDEECGSPPGPPGAPGGFRQGVLSGYMALNLLEAKAGPEKQKDAGGFGPASSCKGGVSGLHAAPYVCLGFKEATTAAQD